MSKTMDNEELISIVLRPCPFCGGDAYFMQLERAGTFDVMMIECRKCGAAPYAVQVDQIADEKDKRAALVKLWNRRANDETKI